MGVCKRLVAVGVGCLVLSGCSRDEAKGNAAGPGVAQTVSLLGKPLYPVELPPKVQAEREKNLAAAQRGYEADPRNEDRIIWLGRRLAYLSEFKDAIDVYTDGLALHPESHKLLRHRGHRYISLRRFDDAIADLDRAAKLIEGRPDEVEPDGLPNRQNIPTSTSHSNIYYHLGLAHYLKGELDEALAAYLRCMEFSTNNDMRCATSNWLYLTLKRLGRDGEAAEVLEPITAEMELLENFGYHRLLLLYKGELAPPDLHGAGDDDIDDATVAYGTAAWHLYNGENTKATALFRRIVAGPAWPAFGFIAAEAELAGR